MKKNKFLLFSPVILTGTTLATLISCGQTDIKDSKDIYIAVDGVQQDFYNKAIELFKQTDSYKEGFRIKTIAKDVWSALDFSVQGINDNAVPDIFYTPQDRLTDFVQKNAVANLDKFDPNLFDDIAKEVQLTETEKNDAKKFGEVSGVSRDGLRTLSQLVGIRHNKEGIIIASNKSELETRNVFNNPSSDTLKELVESGEIVLRLQDLWYGNGIFYGGMKAYWDSLSEEEQTRYGKKFGEALASKTIYADPTTPNKHSSGFIKGDKYHPIYKKGLEAVVDVLWPVINAAYFMTDEEYSQTPWAKKDISRADLQGLYTKEVGNVQSRIFELMAENKLSYTIIGTWDVQVAQRTANAKSFFNVIKVNENTEYKQAPGAWSFMINARNNGASEARRKAISQFIKNIFEVDPYYNYFKQDSKVPYSQSRQEAINQKISEDNKAKTKEISDLATELGYTDVKDLKASTDLLLQPVINFRNEAIFWNSWSSDEDKTNPLGEQNIIKKEKMSLSDVKKISIVQDSDYATLNSSLEDAIPLRNAVAAILGLTNDWDSQLQGNQQTWQIGDSLLKEGEFDRLAASNDIVQDATNKTFHIRKVEKMIFGANGDNKTTDVAQLIAKISEAITNNTLDTLISDVVTKAKTFAKSSKTPASDEVVEKAANLYFNNYVNAAKTSKVIENALTNYNIPKKDKTPSNYKVNDVISKLEEYDKLLSFDKILAVMSSTKPIAENGLGSLNTQTNRFDSSNPQFVGVWEKWNNLILGNVEWYKTLKDNNVKTRDKFLTALEDKFSTTFADFASAIQQGTTVLKLDA